MLYIFLPPHVYTVITGETVDPPVDPGSIPPYLHGGDAPTNHVIFLTWQNPKEAHQNYLRCNQVAIAKTKWALSADIQAALTQLSLVNPDQIFVLFFHRLYKKYGHNTPHDTKANSARMRVAWDPMTSNIANFIRQIWDASLYAHFTSEIKLEHRLITPGEAIVLNTGLFKKEYNNWHARQPDQRTWNDFEVFWKNYLDLWHETTNTTFQSGFGGNAEGA